MAADLKRILKCVSKNELNILLSKWGRIPTQDVNYNVPKYEIVQQVSELAESHHIEDEEVGCLDLLRLVNNPMKKTWKAWQMKKEFTGQLLTEENFQPKAFQCNLMKQLYVAYACTVQVIEHKFALWGRVTQPRSTQVLYFIHYPFSPYVLFSKCSSKLVGIVQTAILRQLGYEDIINMELESSDPDSLAQMLLHNSDEQSQYWYDKGCYKPTKRYDDEKIRSFCDKRVQIEHLPELRRTKNHVDRQFGDKLQPILSVVEVTSDTRFRGQKYNPGVDPTTNIQCKTRLIGSSVLEGLRKAALLDLCCTPLPKYLTNVPKTGLQRLKLTDKYDGTGNRHTT